MGWLSWPRELNELHCLCALLKGKGNKSLLAMIWSEVVGLFAAIGDITHYTEGRSGNLVFMCFGLRNMERLLLATVKWFGPIREHRSILLPHLHYVFMCDLFTPDTYSFLFVVGISFFFSLLFWYQGSNLWTRAYQAITWPNISR